MSEAPPKPDVQPSDNPPPATEPSEARAGTHALSPGLQKICEIVGEGNYSTDPIDMLAYTRDLAPMPEELLRSYGMEELQLVVRPRSTEHVAAILREANRHDIPITPRGGGSFAMGGTIPIEGGVVLDLCGMNEVLEVNAADRIARVQCGATWRRLAERLAKDGLAPQANPSSGVSATIGGYLGTGGGAGIGVPRYGVIGNSVLSLKVVLPTGEIVETNPWDSWLFIGAEGTLGVVCEAALKVVPLLERRNCMFAFSKLGDGVRALEALARLKPSFLHFLDSGAVGFLNADGAKLDDAEMTIVASFEADAARHEEIAAQVESICAGAKRYPQEVADHEWENRYKIEISFKRLGPTLMLQEIRLPFRNLEAVLRELGGVLRTWEWGVQCLSSDHQSVCLLIYALTDERKKKEFYRALGLAREIPRIGYRNHGTVYGIGLHNSAHLARIHARSARTMMTALKRRLDPRLILNPSKTIAARVPGAVADVSLLLMGKTPGLMRVGLGIARRMPKSLIRFGLRLSGGRLR